MQCKTLFMRIDPFFRAPQHTWKDWASRAAREWTPLEGTQIKKKTLNLSNYYSKDQDLLFLYFLCAVCVPPEHCTSSQTCLQQPNQRRCFSSCLSSHPRCNVPFPLELVGRDRHDMMSLSSLLVFTAREHCFTRGTVKLCSSDTQKALHNAWGSTSRDLRKAALLGTLFSLSVPVIK